MAGRPPTKGTPVRVSLPRSVPLSAALSLVLPALDARNHAAALALATLPERIRGFGHVKLANLATAKAQQPELLRRFAAGEAQARLERAGRIVDAGVQDFGVA